jgi:hypothetical protein
MRLPITITTLFVCCVFKDGMDGCMHACIDDDDDDDDRNTTIYSYDVLFIY